jgi:spore coat protein CotH
MMQFYSDNFMRTFFFLVILVLKFYPGFAQTSVGTDAAILVNSAATNITIEVKAQTPSEFTSSNLPIVVITTNNGQTIPDDPKIAAVIKIFNKGSGQRNYLTDVPEFDGHLGIEIRGSSSQQFPKKSYGIESWDALGNSVDVSFLGMPAESDWILNANYTDKSFLRNVMAYQLWQNMGHYATRYHFVELILNGQYAGIYIFSEKIKRDKNRLDIAKLSTTQNTGDEVTGGYIFKVDKQTGSGGLGWTSSYRPLESSWQTVYYQYEYPKAEEITTQQRSYIQSNVYAFETALKSANFADTLTGYRKYAKEDTFIDYFLVNELSKNVDGYRISTFMNKERDSKGGKIRMGPVWDYDIAWHNANYCEGDITTGWAYKFPCPDDYWQVPFWWSRLLEDPRYVNNLACRWQNLRQTALSSAWFDNYIDSISGQLMEAQQRNFTQWPILGVYVWPNPWPYPSTYMGEVNALKTWMHNRLSWLDANMPGNCNQSYGIAETEAENTFNIYPNPVSDNLNIEFRTTRKSSVGIIIVNQQGLILTNIKHTARSSGEWAESFTVSSYKPGVYLLRITIDGKIYNKRFIKI